MGKPHPPHVHLSDDPLAMARRK